MKKISEFSEGSKIKTYYQYELFFHKIFLRIFLKGNDSADILDIFIQPAL